MNRSDTPPSDHLGGPQPGQPDESYDVGAPQPGQPDHTDAGRHQPSHPTQAQPAAPAPATQAYPVVGHTGGPIGSPAAAPGQPGAGQPGHGPMAGQHGPTGRPGAMGGQPAGASTRSSTYGRGARSQHWPPFSLGEALVAGGAALIFLFSFAPFVTYINPEMIAGLQEENLPTWFSAWGLETFMAPLSWWVVIAALGMGALLGLRFVVAKDREFVGFRLSQLQVGLSFFAVLVLLGYALSAKTLVFGSEFQEEVIDIFDNQGMGADLAFGWGGVLMLLGALVAGVGAVLDHLNVGPTVWPPQPKPAPPYPGAAPQGYGHPQAGYPPPAPGQPHGYQPGYQQPAASAYQPPAYHQPTQVYPQAAGPAQSQPENPAPPESRQG